MYCVGIMTNATKNVNARENETERAEDQRNASENQSANENVRGIVATKGPTRHIAPDTKHRLLPSNHYFQRFQQQQAHPSSTLRHNDKVNSRFTLRRIHK